MSRALQTAKVLAGLLLVALLLNGQVSTLAVAEDKGEVKKEVKEVKVNNGKAKIVEINGKKYLVFPNGKKIEVRGSIKREVLPLGWAGQVIT